MLVSRRSVIAALLLGSAVLSTLASGQALAATAAEIDAKVDAALKTLYDSRPDAKALADQSAGVLVFPSILKGGLGIGGAFGDGALRIDGKSTGYYNSFEASFGLQAGVQSFSYALFFMNEEALKYLEDSSGWEVGVGPSIVVIDAGAGGNFSTTTAKDDVYAFIYGQQGLMAGIGIEGSKITEITPDP
jgi:lipid-binding SYLF domain-containing protein